MFSKFEQSALLSLVVVLVPLAAEAGTAFVKLNAGSSSSSGVFVTGELILTCAHGKRTGENLGVIVNRAVEVQGTVAFVDAERDLAFVQCSAPASVRPYRIAPGEAPEPGSMVQVAGFGQRVFYRRRTEVVDRIGGDFMQLETNGRPGDSGSGVISDRGEVVGIVVRHMSNNASQEKLKDGSRGGDALAVPLDEIQAFVADWNAHLEKERQKAEKYQQMLARAREAAEKYSQQRSAQLTPPSQMSRAPIRRYPR